MAEIHEYVHCIPSLEVYPRAYYYCRRLSDVLGKFNRFIGKYKHILPDDYKRSVPETNTLQSGVTIRIIGRCDLDPKDFLDTKSDLYKVERPASQNHIDYIVPNDPYKDKLERPTPPCKEGPKPMEYDVTADVSQHETEHASSPDIKITVCYADITRLDDKGIKEIHHLTSHLPKYDMYTDIQSQHRVIFCRCDGKFSKQEEESFRRKLELGILNHVVIRKKVGENITQILISELSERFSDLESDLQVCVNSERVKCSSQGSLLKMDLVDAQLRTFLLYSLEYPDVIETTVKGEKELQTVLRRIARLLRCALVYPLSCKYNIPASICNKCFIESDFEQRLIESITENTQKSLMAEYTSRNQNKTHVLTENRIKASCACLASLQLDLDGLVTDTCRKLNSFASTVRKMRLEISACQRKINATQSKEMTHPASNAINDFLRNYILNMEDVYGVGNIYDQLEIHVNTEKVVKKVEDKVANLFRKKNISCPFTVRAIAREPTMFADYQYEHGTEIQSSVGSGTLGGFLNGTDNHLYGITCAHVVGGRGQEKDLLIPDHTGNQRVLFARTVPNMIVSTGNPSKPLIDLAAVRVFDYVKHRCMKFLKDDEGKIRQGILATNAPRELHGSYVYKHGARSNLTKGIVCSEDYSVLSPHSVTYIMLIDNYDDDDSHFAQRGDSGSIISTPDENSVYRIKAVGVLSAGEFRPADQETPLCFSFRLHDGLTELTRQAGVRFTFPEDY